MFSLIDIIRKDGRIKSTIVVLSLSREQTVLSGTCIIKETRVLDFHLDELGGTTSMRIPSNLPHWFNVIPRRIDSSESRRTESERGDRWIIKIEFLRISSADRKGFTAMSWWNRHGGWKGSRECDVKGQEETEKKNEIHRDIGWQLTANFEDIAFRLEVKTAFSTYCSPWFTPKP